ncbi:MAG: 16S rRNA (guanine(527)-N(7))-methyltransferase RsmG [SAR202 cluster bacterium]|nr:16S rRNA (guanine(527)-N(7))-methyltransferase RsmG [SAR202 cluster bacterium]|tara:strand:- start:3772 stop:4494 length:723 start_codon:yes stop_codon:yes gene_type:complete
MDLLKKYASVLNINISDGQLNSFRLYSEQLIKWNAKFNITRITSPEEIQIKHFLDSITLLKLIPNPIPVPMSLIDIGSGGGFPGIPLKIMIPQIDVTLLEATGKKCDFLSHISKTLGLEKIQIVKDRAESLSHNNQFRNQFDLVTSRALASTATLVELSAGFCKTGGNIITWKTASSSNISDAQRVLKILTSQSTPPETLEHFTTIPEIQFSQCLVQIPKQHDIAERYPRQNGIPKKRPL